MITFRVVLKSGLVYDVEAASEDDARSKVCAEMLRSDDVYFSKFTTQSFQRTKTKPEHYLPVIKEIQVLSGKCNGCKKEVEWNEVKKSYDAGQDVFCSQYCFEVSNGLPIPGTQSELVFDKIFNQ